MKFAGKQGYNYVIVLGEEELSTGVVSVKNMQTGEEEKVEITRISDFLRR